MGILRRVTRTAIPVSRVGAAMWAWRHRSEIGGWAGYVARAAPRVAAGDTTDVLVEGRLRARLTGDRRTRNVDGLQVEVSGGVAHLRGMVSAEARDAALAIATNTTGVHRVRDETTVPTRRRRWATA
jgi:osmotically-inducible protein OsmY